MSIPVVWCKGDLKAHHVFSLAVRVKVRVDAAAYVADAPINASSGVEMG